MRVVVVVALMGVIAPVTVLGCSTGSSVARPAPRALVDALGHQCAERLTGAFVAIQGNQDCPQTTTFWGARTISCQGTAAPMGGCDAGVPCWELTSVGFAHDPFGGVGGPMVPSDGGWTGAAIVCADCCWRDDAGTAQSSQSLTDCAAIPCKSAADCPLESCGCSGGWCQ